VIKFQTSDQLCNVQTSGVIALLKRTGQRWRKQFSDICKTAI